MEFPYIIIDSDQNTSDRVQLLFETYGNFVCTGIAQTETEGLDLILERLPALVFLNLEMPGAQSDLTLYTIISQLRQYVDKLPQFIVMAKTSNYAIEGIRHGVLDYLLKPLDKNIMRRSLMRFQKDTNFEPEPKICFKSYGDYRFLNLDEVIYLKADNNTTDFSMANGSVVGAFKSLKYFENSLPDHFVRIHNSYIVNTNYISRIHFGKSKCTIKNSDSYIPFSKSYRANVEFIKESLFKKSIVLA